MIKTSLSAIEKLKEIPGVKPIALISAIFIATYLASIIFGWHVTMG